MNIYVTQYGAFWKLTLKEWEEVINSALTKSSGYELPFYRQLQRRPSCIVPRTNGCDYWIIHPIHKLYKPLDWYESDWLDAKEELENLKKKA